MAYSDQKYYARHWLPVAIGASFGTATASGATGANTTPSVYLPKFFRRCQINKVALICGVIPDAGSTNLQANFLNGTSTFATVNLTTATAGQYLDGTVTASNAIFAADGQPTLTITGTATASADAQGTYTVEMEVQELFA